MDDGKSCTMVPTSPHFFKIMLDRTIASGKLMIPKKYVRKHGMHLTRCENVLLKVPTVDTWLVELDTSNDSIFLDKGWPNFLRFYSIKPGDLILFRCKSWACSNEFDVAIFDKTSTEIDYPVRSLTSMSEMELEELTDSSLRPVRDHEQGTNQGRGWSENVNGTDDDEDEQLSVQDAAATSSMRPSFTKCLSNSIAGVPKAFARATGLRGKTTVLINDPMERMWPVELREKSNRVYEWLVFGKGWAAFLQGNELAAGDTIKLTYVGGPSNVIVAEILSRKSSC